MNKSENICICCRNIFYSYVKKYCSLQCQIDYQYYQYIWNWKTGNNNGSKGWNKSASNHIRRYLFWKYDDKCVECGWSVIHPTTGRIPLQIDHIDGDFTNNNENNLRLLCPNCHVLTPNYGSLNRGKSKRKKTYIYT
jgi:hypothetical protein